MRYETKFIGAALFAGFLCAVSYGVGAVVAAWLP
jgi:hypothetical protein